MARIAGLTLNPKQWFVSFGQACASLGRGFVEMFSNRRLWIGLVVSILLHAVIMILWFVDLGGFKINRGGDDQILETEFDETMPPQVAQILREQQLAPGSTTAEEGAPIDLSKGKVVFQTKIDADDISLDQGEASFTGDVIRINPNARLSTDEILASAPVQLTRGSGGAGQQSMFDKIAAGAGSPIELDTRGTQIGSEAVKPKFQEEGTSAQDASKAAGGTKQSGFSLSGDLSRGDIVSGPFPAYPAWARQKGLSNVTISVRFSVDASGNVNPTMIVQKSTGYPAWDTAVKSTLGRWKFKPAEGGMGKRNGLITFVFVLT